MVVVAGARRSQRRTPERVVVAAGIGGEAGRGGRGDAYRWPELRSSPAPRSAAGRRGAAPGGRGRRLARGAGDPGRAGRRRAAAAEDGPRGGLRRAWRAAGDGGRGRVAACHVAAAG